MPSVLNGQWWHVFSPFAPLLSHLQILYLNYGGTCMKLREIRKQQELSVPALSRLSNVPIRTIEDLERRDDGRVSTLIKLADALEVTLDELCRD